MYPRPETPFIFDFLGAALMIAVAVGLVLFLRVAYLILMDKDYMPSIGGRGYMVPPPPEPLPRNLNLCEGLSSATMTMLSALQEFDAVPSVTLTFETHGERRRFLREIDLLTGRNTRLDLSSETFNANGIEFKLEIKQENDNEDR